jgi:hypothetical protein
MGDGIVIDSLTRFSVVGRGRRIIISSVIRPYVEIHQGPGSFELPPALTLQLLLEHCEQWIEKVDINKEMPALSFYVSGANGNKQEVKISPYNYVLSKRMDVEAIWREPVTKLMRTFHP